ncbi:MAG: hypothetical protein WDO74_31125 [Pseudomonadota bacterium]
MPEVLAKVTTRTLNVPRGPDVLHRIRVPGAWLESGEVVEFELPRNLTCAACDGGGCDACERAGAITLRGRHELPEILSVTLPMRKPEADSEARGVLIRIPEQGGLPPESGETLPRGLLLLRVERAEVADPGVFPRGAACAAAVRAARGCFRWSPSLPVVRPGCSLC